MNDILSIAKKEILDNIRNKWIIFSTASFIIIAIIASLIGSAFSGGDGSLENLRTTVLMMMFFIQYIVPVIGLMLGYASIVGEIKDGSMNALIAHPVTRFDIILGKFFGLSFALSFSIFLGFGIAGTIIAAFVGTVDFMLYLGFIGLTILLGIVFLSISMFFSSLLNKRSTSIGLSVFIWSLFSFLWGLMLFGSMAANHINPYSSEAGSYFALNLFSPSQVFNSLIAINIGPQPMAMPSLGMSMFVRYFPDFYNNTTLLSIMFIWIISMIALSYIFFSKKDI